MCVPPTTRVSVSKGGCEEAQELIIPRLTFYFNCATARGIASSALVVLTRRTLQTVRLTAALLPSGFNSVKERPGPQGKRGAVTTTRRDHRRSQPIMPSSLLRNMLTYVGRSVVRRRTTTKNIRFRQTAPSTDDSRKA